MPNHVYQHVEITGTPEIIERIAAAATSNKGLLATFYPLPADATKTISGINAQGQPYEYDAFTDTGYAAAVALWGSKWGDYETEILDQTPTSIGLRFTSAWNDSTVGLERLARDHGVTVEVTWQEEFWQDCGAAYITPTDGIVFYTRFENSEALFPEWPDPETDDALEEYQNKRDDAENQINDELLERLTRAKARYAKA